MRSQFCLRDKKDADAEIALKLEQKAQDLRAVIGS
jgi:hypothetical protein